MARAGSLKRLMVALAVGATVDIEVNIPWKFLTPRSAPEWFRTGFYRHDLGPH
jgi:hypothetical protein